MKVHKTESRALEFAGRENDIANYVVGSNLCSRLKLVAEGRFDAIVLTKEETKLVLNLLTNEGNRLGNILEQFSSERSGEVG